VGLSDVVTSGPLALAAGLAVTAGLVSFFSPCCLPLVPGYLSYVGGLAGGEVARGVGAAPQQTPAGQAELLLVPGPGSRLPAPGPASGSAAALTAPAVGPARTRALQRRVVTGALLFVLGFAAVFASYGAAFGAVGGTLAQYQRQVSLVLGGLSILLGLVFAGLLRLPLLGRTVRVGYRPAAGLAGAPVLGALFGVGWTPCIGPTLGAVLTLSFDSATAWRGALLAFLYSLGLGAPFVLFAAFLGRALPALAFVRHHSVWVMRCGGLQRREHPDGQARWPEQVPHRWTVPASGRPVVSFGVRQLLLCLTSSRSDRNTPSRPRLPSTSAPCPAASRRPPGGTARAPGTTASRCWVAAGRPRRGAGWSCRSRSHR